MCHRSASLLRRQHLSKLETGAGFRGWCQAALLLSCECLGGRQGTLPFTLPSATAYELLLLHMLLCIKCGHQACGHVCITSPLIVFSLRKWCPPDQPAMPWACMRLHRHRDRPACPCLGRLAVAGMLQLLLSPSLACRVSALENTMSDKGSSMDGKTDIVNGKGASGDQSLCAWGLLLGRFTVLSAPCRQLVQQPGGDVSRGGPRNLLWHRGGGLRPQPEPHRR